MEVVKIQGLLSEVAGHLEKIKPENTKQHESLETAVKYLASYERQQLYDLRKAFE